MDLIIMLLPKILDFEEPTVFCRNGVGWDVCYPLGR